MIKDEINKNGTSCSLNHIDTSKISNMANLFDHSKFTGDISEWDVSNVKSMFRMFAIHGLMVIYLNGMFLM